MRPERQLIFQKEDWLKHQWEFLTSEDPIVGLVTGYGGGKTYCFLRKTLIKHIFAKGRDGKSNGWVIYPSLKMAQELFVEQFKELLRNVGIKFSFNQQFNRFVSAYGTLHIHTQENIDAMIGSNLTFAGFDEFDTATKERALRSFKAVVGRMRGAEKTQIYVVTTPEGFKATYHIFVEKADEAKKLIKAKSSDNPFLPKEYLEQMAREYDPKLLKAYMDGEFVNLNFGSVYYGFERDVHLDDSIKVIKELPVNICFDFNVFPMSTVWAQHTCKEDIRFLGEWVSKSHSNTYEACRGIKESLPTDIDVVIYGDAAGRYGSANSNMTNYQIIEQELRPYFKSMTYKVPAANPFVKDRVNCFNSLLAHNSIRIHPSCNNFLADLEQVVWNEKGSELDKSDIRRTHITDAGGYYLFCEFPIVQIRNSIETKSL